MADVAPARVRSWRMELLHAGLSAVRIPLPSRPGRLPERAEPVGQGIRGEELPAVPFRWESVGGLMARKRRRRFGRVRELPSGRFQER
jgi:hypothetical protein